MLTDWLLNEYILGPQGLGSPYIDGFYIDDSWSSKGPSEEDPRSVKACGLTPSDVADLTSGWSANMGVVQAGILKHGGYNDQVT